VYQVTGVLPYLTSHGGKLKEKVACGTPRDGQLKGKGLACGTPRDGQELKLPRLVSAKN
jgi:hypothetical protein